MRLSVFSKRWYKMERRAINMKREKVFTWGTREGCLRLLALFLVIVLVSSFAARMISSDAGSVKITRVTFDSRGATIDADLYYPAGTSDSDKLPAVLVFHGAGVGSGMIKGYAEELARRGFVALNVNAYGMGLSETPISDEAGIGEAEYKRLGTPHGMLDALEFVRTLNFVDQTRIGMTGHSLGPIRICYAAMTDCGYYNFNDIMLNILHDTFGQAFTEEEINQDADTLAQARLDASELAHYTDLRETARLNYDTRIRALCLVGYNPNNNKQLQLQAVDVAGHEVMRNCQVNVGLIAGTNDMTHRKFSTDDATKANWYLGSENAQLETWYALDDSTASSSVLGGMSEISIASSTALQDAVANRSSRICMLNAPETHSKNLLSSATVGDMVHYFEQALNYNRGNLTDSSSQPLNAYNIVYIWREVLNMVAMIAMVCALIAAAGVLVRTKFFAPCVAEPVQAVTPFNKQWYWIFAAISVVIGFVAIWRVNKLFVPALPYIDFLPIQTWWLTMAFVGFMALGSVLLLLVCWLKDRKEAGLQNFKVLNLGAGIIPILKSILLGAVLLALGYLSLVLIEDLFNQDYRMWLAAFTEMKIEYWRYVWRFGLVLIPCFLALGASTNFMVRKDIPEWLDTLITVVINSIGVWLCCFISYSIMVGTGSIWSNFISTYQVLLIAPLTTYITRKCYKVTNSIWLGAVLNAYLIAWSMISSNGLDINHYFPQTWASVFFSL